MEALTLDAHLAPPVTIDVCASCQGFWFDKYESLKLSAASTLNLIKFIGDHSLNKPTLAPALSCPRCPEELKLTRDMQRSTRFSYWRCPNDDGRFIGFFDFLREKNFVRPLTPAEIEEMRKNVQIVNCSSCGGPIDLVSGAVCSHCGSPVSILDMKQPQELLEQLKKASEPRKIDPTLPLELALIQRRMDAIAGPSQPGDVLEASVNAVARWLAKSGL